MANYEVMFIIDPALEEEQQNAALETVKGIIADNGTLGEVDDWGMRKLAYPIRKKKEGHYVVIPFQAEPDMPKELDRRLRISDALMRHIIVNTEEK